MPGLRSPVSLALITCVLSSGGQELNFERFVPSDLLQHYYNFGVPQKLKFKTQPIKNGLRIVVLGILEDKSLDSEGPYVDLQGTPSMGGGRGVVRIYLSSRELDKLQSKSYVYDSLLHQGSQEIAVEARLVGLNEYGSLEMRDGYLVPWASVLLGSGAPPVAAPASRVQSPSRTQTAPDWSSTFSYQGTRISTTATSIRTIDFANFDYPWHVLQNRKPVSMMLRLRSGEALKQTGVQEAVKLASVRYGDVTGDGVDDAIVMLSVKSDGLIPDRGWTATVFICTLRSGFVTVLAEFNSGFTLRRVGGLNGELVIESDQIGDSGMCCPVALVESLYKWTGERFIQASVRTTPLRQ